MQEQFFRERDDLQRLLKKSMSVIGEDLYLLAEEFSQWEDSRRRIDLLALDRAGLLVVIELKRTEDGGHMELQALRYAAMISTMTFPQAVGAHAQFRGSPAAMEDAEAAILDFLGWSEPSEDFGKGVRIILVAPEFSKELTTTVFWLRDAGIDIRCLRIRPYDFHQRTILEVDQIVPLREAQDYTVRWKEKQEENRRAAEFNIDFTRYDLTFNGHTYSNLWKRNLFWQAVASAIEAGTPLSKLESILPRQKLIVVHGALSGEAFASAAEAKRASEGYAFDPRRYFLDDAHLLHVEGKTFALSNQWNISSLPLLAKLIDILPSGAEMSYAKNAESG